MNDSKRLLYLGSTKPHGGELLMRAAAHYRVDWASFVNEHIGFFIYD